MILERMYKYCTYPMITIIKESSIYSGWQCFPCTWHWKSQDVKCPHSFRNGMSHPSGIHYYVLFEVWYLNVLTMSSLVSVNSDSPDVRVQLVYGCAFLWGWCGGTTYYYLYTLLPNDFLHVSVLTLYTSVLWSRMMIRKVVLLNNLLV